MRLHSEVSGSGRDLVLLHGWGMHAGIWEALAQQLSRCFRVHAVDLPGYGASPGCEPYTLTRLAAELKQNMPPRCLVCGWSMGGQLALTWAGAAPHQVERLALVATTPCFTRRADWPHAMERSVLLEFARALAADYEATLGRFLGLQALGDGHAKQVLSQLKKTLFVRGRPDACVLEAGLKILLDTDLRGRVPSVTQPVRIYHGDCDTLAPLAAAEYLQKALPDARLTVMRGAAHAPFIANAPHFSALLTEFFQ